MTSSNARHDSDELRGSVALVTGGNRGIGLGFVEELLERGARKVYAGVRDPEGSKETLAPLGVDIVALDVTDQHSVRAAASACGDVTLVVNNAGFHARDRLVMAKDPDVAREEMEVNYFGVLNMTRAFAPVLGANGGGGIINVLSVAGAFPAAFMGGYSPAKAAALFLSTITRAELAPQGTKVCALIVGSTDTRMSAHYDGPKESPRTVARNGLNSYVRGEYVADTDLMAVDSRARFARDPARYERHMMRLLDGL
jgi:NAD(P)-dependent dehydrogenase (short-subunit alcohol dehydrogenase family)